LVTSFRSSQLKRPSRLRVPVKIAGTVHGLCTFDHHGGRALPVALINRKGLKMDKATKPAARAAGQTMDLSDLLEHALKDMYYAEKKIYKSLPKMIKAANDPALQEGLSAHRDETAQQIEILEEIFTTLGKRAKAEKCDAIDGILEESTSLLDDFKGSAALDAAIIFSAQAVEHYEITRYGSMQTYAQVLGMSEVADMLGQILKQELAADKTLTSLAKGRVNAAAA
jgi:ferritin-like metal-binding protein YciE